MSVIEQSTADLSQPPGVILRTTRERAGLTLDAVAQRTMIPLSRLRALEDDDYERVGVATFAIGYTRSYARFLGIDATPLVQALEASLPQTEPLPELSSPVALALHVQRRPRSFFWPTILAVVVVLVVVAVIGINTASLVSSNPAPREPSVATGDGTLSVPLELSVTTQPSTPAELLPEAPVAGSSEQDSLGDEDFAQESATAAEPQTISSVEQTTPSPAGTSSTITATDTLLLTFTGDCWTTVTDATGKALIARLATSGDNLQLFGRAPFEVLLGDAGVAGITFNGRVIDSAPQPGRKARRLTVGP